MRGVREPVSAARARNAAAGVSAAVSIRPAAGFHSVAAAMTAAAPAVSGGTSGAMSATMTHHASTAPMRHRSVRAATVTRVARSPRSRAR